jgi:hypothetical protein
MQPNGSLGPGPDLNRQAAQANFVKKPLNKDKKHPYHVSNFKFYATIVLFLGLVGLLIWFALSSEKSSPR